MDLEETVSESVGLTHLDQDKVYVPPFSRQLLPTRKKKVSYLMWNDLVFILVIDKMLKF